MTLLERTVAALFVIVVGTGCSSGPTSTIDRRPHAPNGTAEPSAPATTPAATGTSPTPPPPPPSGPVPLGNISFRVANFLATTGDVCIKGDDGVWKGPLFRTVANGPLPSGAVSERWMVKNSHFTARVVDSDCATARGADVKVPLVSGGWSVTLVLGDAAGGPKIGTLVDGLTASAVYSFVRLVNTGGWAMNADLGYIDDDGEFAGICLDAPFLGTPKTGTIDAQGYAFLAPLDGNMSLVLRGTASQDSVLQIDGLMTNANKIYTLYTTGTLDTPSVLLCDDEAPATNHLASCTALPN